MTALRETQDGKLHCRCPRLHSNGRGNCGGDNFDFGQRSFVDIHCSLLASCIIRDPISAAASP